MHFIKQLDKALLDLAWSLWTELGVAGVKQNHQDHLIWIEELIIFTSVLSEIDPRLRNESLDWCVKYHKFISVSRLKSLLKNFHGLVEQPFSQYASNFNQFSIAKWPVITATQPEKIKLSCKSSLKQQRSPSLLDIRARSIFGTGARADLVAFFLTHPNMSFSIAEVAAIGYSKRNLSEVLESLYDGNLFDRVMQGNQFRYRIKANDLLAPNPKKAPSWDLIFKVLLTLRACLYRTENLAESTKVVEIRSALKGLEKTLQKLGYEAPAFKNDFALYLKQFAQWLLELTQVAISLDFGHSKKNLT